MSTFGFSVFDLLEARDLEGDILVFLTRHSPIAPETLLEGLDCPKDQLDQALTALANQGRVRFLPDGQIALAFRNS